MWQSNLVRNRLFQRWFVVLGMIAMLGALIAMPLTSTYALAVAGAKTTTTAAMDEMPCHKPAKPCPHCPQKVCPDMGSCLVKCFQSLSLPVSEAASARHYAEFAGLADLSQVTSDSLIPPLLRPPSV